MASDKYEGNKPKEKELAYMLCGLSYRWYFDYVEVAAYHS
jgi:hypothetical protein